MAVYYGPVVGNLVCRKPEASVRHLGSYREKGIFTQERNVLLVPHIGSHCLETRQELGKGGLAEIFRGVDSFLGYLEAF